MNHAGDGLLQAYIDGEVTGEAQTSLVAHLGACVECDRDLAELRSAAAKFHGAMTLFSSDIEMNDALERVLHAHKAVGAVPDAAPGATTVTSIDSRRKFSRFATGSLARAAALVLLLAGSVAAMIPGSPLRRWIGGSIERISSVIAPRNTTAPVITTTAPAAPRREMVPGAEMSIAPVNSQVKIDVSSAIGSGELTIRLVDADRATVQADSSARNVSFRSAPGRVEILNLGTADAAIELPRSLRSALITVNGKSFLVKDGDALRVTGPVIRRTDSEVVFQTGS